MPTPIRKTLNSPQRTMDMLPASSRPKTGPSNKKTPDTSHKDTSFQSPDSSPEFFYTQPKEKKPSGKFEFIFLLFILILVAGGIFLVWKETRRPVPKTSIEKQAYFPKMTAANPQETSSAIQEKPAERTVLPSEDSVKEDAPIENESDFTFAILGDTQRFDEAANDGGFQQAIDSLKPKSPSFIVAVGDLLSSCDGLSKCENNLNNWKKILGDFFAKTYVVMGNHDRTGKEKADALWQKFFTLPENGPEGFKELVYSFDHKDAHFIVLNSAKPKENLINAAQQDWLEKDLAKNTKKHTFVFFHEPAYPTASKIDEGLDHNPEERDALWKILEKYKVTAVFSGHEHIQSHKKIGTIDQFIFGNTDAFDHELPETAADEFAYVGEGYGVVSVSQNNTKVEFFSVGGDLLKSIVLEK